MQDSAMSLIALSMGASCSTRTPVRNYSSSHKGYAYLGMAMSEEQNILKKIDLSTYESEDIVLPVGRLHAVTKSAANPDEIFVLDFQGSALKVNTRTKEVLAKVDHRVSGEGHFYGHAVHDPADDILWCTEQTGGKSLVRARSGKDLRLLPQREYAFGGGHHVTRIPGTTLISTAGSDDNGQHFVAFYDTAKKRMEKIVRTDFPGVHVLPISATEVISVTTQFTMTDERLKMMTKYSDPRLRGALSEQDYKFAGTSPLLYANISGDTKNYWDISRTELFQLGLGLDRLSSGAGYVTTHHASDTVIIWKDFKVHKVIKVPGPLVVVATLDGSEIAVQSEGGLKVYSLSSGELVKDLKYPFPVITLSKY